MKNIPENVWVEIPDEELAKIGKTQWVYKPSNYEPMVFEATICNQEGAMPRIWVNKEQAKKILGLE